MQIYDLTLVVRTETILPNVVSFWVGKFNFPSCPYLGSISMVALVKMFRFITSDIRRILIPSVYIYIEIRLYKHLLERINVSVYISIMC